MVDEESIPIAVGYGISDPDCLIEFRVPVSTTLRDAIILSGILDRFPGIDLATAKTGIFGQLAPLEKVLKSHDRVEIYRPLLVNPREARRQRARKNKTSKN